MVTMVADAPFLRERNRATMPVTPTPREVGFDFGLPENLREQYVTVAFAAEVTGVAPGTLARHLRNGTLAGNKIGNFWLVSREALITWEPGKPGNPKWTRRDEDDEDET